MNRALNLAAAGIGFAVAGPLGGFCCGIAAEGLPELAGFVKDNFNAAGNVAANFCYDQLKQAFGNGTANTPRAAAIREALRDALRESRHADFQDWFANWDAYLEKAGVLEVASAESLVHAFVADGNRHGLLFGFLERVDFESRQSGSLSIVPAAEDRCMPEDLRAHLVAGMLPRLDAALARVFSEEKHRQAWRSEELTFQRLVLESLGRIEDGVKLGFARNTVDHAETQRLLRELLQGAPGAAKRLQEELDKTKLDRDAKDREAQEWMQRYCELEASLGQRPDLESATAARLVREGRLEEAVELYERELLPQAHEQLAAYHFDLGRIHLLRFDPVRALPACERAYRLAPENRAYAYAYAGMLQEQEQHRVAIELYERLLIGSVNPTERAGTLNNLAMLYVVTQRHAKAEDAYAEALVTWRQQARRDPAEYLPYIATTLNNLAILYVHTQRHGQAEEVYRDALGIRRDLARLNPDTHLPDVAATLNNLAGLYRATQRHGQAELAYNEALLIRRQLANENPERYLPDVATTLNNQGFLYSETQRHGQAEQAYREALSIRLNLAARNPDVYSKDVVATLNNLGLLYSHTQRPADAEEVYQKALQRCRDLATSNPEAHVPLAATTLHNFAILYKATKRPGLAEGAYREALGMRLSLAKLTPEAYLPYVATTLNNLANLHSATQRPSQAEQEFRAALAIYRELAQGNPAAYLPDVATTLNNLAALYGETQRQGEAEKAATEAWRIFEPHWRRQPAVHGDQTARIALLLAMLATEPEKKCAWATLAAEAAFHTDLRSQAAALRAEHCPS